jgi:hypothetical protein
MAYYKAKLKSGGDKNFPFPDHSEWDGLLSVRILIYVSFKYVLIYVISFMGTISYNTCPVKSINK